MTQFQPVCLADYEKAALAALPADRAAYLFAGAADEITCGANRDAWDRLGIVPRVLRKVAGGNTKVSVLGRELAHPILVAPMAFQKLAHPDGEAATAAAAAAQEALMVLSCQSSTTIEEVSRAGGSARWLQIYFQPSRDDTLKLIRSAEAAGFEAIVVTCDAPLTGIRNAEQRAGFQLPPDIRPVNMDGFTLPPFQPLNEGESVIFDRLTTFAASWDDIAWLKKQTTLPIVLKGLLSPADAKLAIEAGASGVIVSNHGGRTLDTAIASLDALPDIVAVARPAGLSVLVDGGITRGTDVLKALALGAHAVLLGRPILHGLAAKGALGVSHVLRILRDEFEVAMALAGCRTTAEITDDIVRR